MMVKKQSEEALRRRREQKKEYMRKARERLKADPLLHAEIKRKDRERYQEAKKQGKVKLIQELSRKEQRRTRKMWRQRAQKYRDRLAEKDVVEDLKDDLKLTLDPGDVSSCTVIIKNKSRFSILHNK